MPAFDPRARFGHHRERGTAAVHHGGLDALEDRLMFRPPISNLGTSESLVMTHTVNAAVYPAYRAAVRFTICAAARRLVPSASARRKPSMIGAADTAHRWMGSVAMNHQGDIALGYQRVQRLVSPSIRYAARLAPTPSVPAWSAASRASLPARGAQTSTSSRWAITARCRLTRSTTAPLVHPGVPG